LIDTHAHLVSGDIKNYPPAPPSGQINEDTFENPMTVEMLVKAMDDCGVAKALLVQRGSIYGFDNSYVCDSADRFKDRLAAVCAIDGTAPDCAQHVRHWVQSRGAVGIRLMELVRTESLAWLDSESARGAWQTAAELGVPVSVHLFPWNRIEGLKRLGILMNEIPGLSVVLDHFAAIQSDAGPPDHGVDELLEKVAVHEGVNVKFTTIPLGRLDAAGVDFRPLVARVMRLFGSSRMMWGSDVAQSPGSYDYMVDLGRTAVERLPSADQDQILNLTAARVFGNAWVRHSD
jgi:L-fuconolactonase